MVYFRGSEVRLAELVYIKRCVRKSSDTPFLFEAEFISGTEKLHNKYMQLGVH